MKKFILIGVILVMCITSLGQVNIENKLSEAHQNIKGTKVSLIPPKGFIKARNFSGLQQAESGSSIMIIDMPAPFAEISRAITKEEFLRTGVELSKIEQLTINGLPAVLATGTQTANGNLYTKKILVIGTKDGTIMINGVNPAAQKVVSDEILKSMLTAIYAADTKVNPFEELDYSIDVSGTKLKFGHNMSNSLMFSVDGRIPTASNDKTTLIVGKSHSEIEINDKRSFAINRIRRMPLDIDGDISTYEITIDAISGYEMYAKGHNKDSGEPEISYCVILFNGNLYYILLGMSNDISGESVGEIKRAIMTFKRK